MTVNDLVIFQKQPSKTSDFDINLYSLEWIGGGGYENGNQPLKLRLNQIVFDSAFLWLVGLETGCPLFYLTSRYIVFHHL